MEVSARSRSLFEKETRELTVAQWVFDHGKPAGAGTDTLPGGVGTYFPIVADGNVLGVLGVKSMYYNESVDESQHPILKTFANSMAIALERAVLAKESHEARLSAEAEKLRSSLLSSVSHDIRTPLTVIQGAASAIVAGQGEAQPFAQTILEQADRLNRNVRNLLDMTRLDSGEVKPKMEWNAPEELVGNALQHVGPTLAEREIKTAVPENLPLVKADGLLLEQALVNLLENAARHTPEGTPIEVAVAVADGRAEFRVSDRGPGIPMESRATLFEKFTQVRNEREGFGLGLAIASAAMRAQAGSVEYRDRPGGGSTFVLILPATERPPEVPPESMVA
jgi:two-component system sensor histidine kinase KdpD